MQPSFELTVQPDAHDGFFNSPVSYRGQFARSEEHGKQANRKLLPRLLEAAANHRITSYELVVASLSGRQARIWIDESEVEDQLSDPASHILFPQWPFNDPNGPGLRAPGGTKLGVKGAWVSRTGHEVTSTAKHARGATSIGRETRDNGNDKADLRSTRNAAYVSCSASEWAAGAGYV